MTVTSTYSRETINELVANTYTTGDQHRSDVLWLSNGGMVVAYNNHDVADGFVLLDFYGPDGQHVVRRAAYSALNTTSAFETPSLMQLPNGYVFVAWADVNGPNPGVKYSAYSPTGDVLALEHMVYASDDVSQVSAAAVGDSALMTFVMDGKVHLRFSEPIDPTTPGEQGDSQIAALTDGGFVVAWMNNPAGINDQEIRASVFNADGSARGPAFTVDTIGNNLSPAVAALQNGNWAVVYTNTSWGDESGSTGISLQIRDANGNNVTPGGTIHVNTPSALGEQTPDVTVLANGFILVTWAKETAADRFDIFGRLLSEGGAPIAVDGADEFVVSGVTGDNRHPAIAATSDGRFITTWDYDAPGLVEIVAGAKRIERATTGDGADDTFFGDVLSDSVDGGGGNDTLGGGKGNDGLVGGTGSDRFVYRPGDGRDTIVDFTNDFFSHDKIDVSAFGLSFTELMAHATQFGPNTEFNFGNGDVLTLLGVQKASLGAGDFSSIISGDDGDNVLSGTPGYDTIEGLGGNDTVVFSQTLDKYNLTDFGNKIAVSGPEGVDILTSIEHLQFADGTVHVNDGSALFDTAFYMRNNLDVFHAGVNALDHFNAIGWQEGRDPNAFFDTSGYLAVNTDVAAAGINPLDHYHLSGWHEGRDPGANFDTTLYLLRNPDVAAAGMDPLQHYLQFGRAEGRQAYEAVGQNIAGGFDAQYYLFHNPDVAAAGIDPLFHFNVVGWQEGRDPNAWFDSSGYLAHYTDVAAAGINPLAHYEAVGWKEGRDASAWFDTAGYLAANPDVAAANYNPLDHFLQHGIFEGRQAINDGMWG
jgi:Ca2+-binding RTX toxin-like protein